MGSGAEALAVQTNFLTPFVFPSGQSCRDFDEFALGCQDQWEFAVDLLQSGFFQQFFSNMGRLDLARFAQESAGFPDRERGLDQFLSRLPIKSVPPAKLSVRPTPLNLGTLQVGQEGHVDLILENTGGRLIFGTLAASVPWLSVSDTGEQKVFQFRTTATIKIGVKGLHLRAGMKPIEGDIFIDSNAGSIKVPVQATVPITPFPEGVLAGSLSPREIAEKARKHPREAAVFFASGLVHQWYAWNGWIYPVEGPPSNGLAAVQQFFEALGLAKAPKVYVTEQQIEVKGAPGAVLKRTLQVRSDEARPVFAHATTTTSWLVAKPGIVQGNVVTLPLEITVPSAPGAAEHGLLRIISNGNQRFDVPIQVTAASTGVLGVPAGGVKRRSKADVGQGQQPILVQPVDSNSRHDFDQATPPPPIDLTPPPFDPIGLVLHLLPLLALAFVFLALLARDVLSGPPRLPRGNTTTKDHVRRLAHDLNWTGQEGSGTKL
ncbi:MAG: hypothetical protein HYX68_12255 [Planctomycetes bacterium]|nr:hypothetical protein [Planctomycetota bacterium]